MGSAMAQRRSTGPDENHAKWLGLAKGVVLIAMAVLVLLLVESMVQHHFFSGGALNYRGGR
jgi:hypothetical protein